MTALPVIPRLARMAQREYLDAVATQRYPVECDIARAAVRDHQLAQSALDRSTDVRMLRENANCIDDDRRGVRRCGGILSSEKVEQPIEIRQGAGAVDDGRPRRSRH